MNDNLIKKVEQCIGYKFKNIDILYQSITHISYSIKHNLNYNNELYEFYGDAILYQYITFYLFKKYSKKYNEGILTKIRSCIISNNSLSSIFNKLKLQNIVLIDKNSIHLNKSNNYKIYANFLEAIICGIKIDGGIQKAKQFIKNIILKNIDINSIINHPDKYVSQLFEYANKYKMKIEFISSEYKNKYHIMNKVVLKINNKKFYTYNAINKKTAKEKLAYKTLNSKKFNLLLNALKTN